MLGTRFDFYDLSNGLPIRIKSFVTFYLRTLGKFPIQNQTFNVPSLSMNSIAWLINLLLAPESFAILEDFTPNQYAIVSISRTLVLIHPCF